MSRNSIMSATVVPTASDEQSKHLRNHNLGNPVQGGSPKEQPNLTADTTSDSQTTVPATPLATYDQDADTSADKDTILVQYPQPVIAIKLHPTTSPSVHISIHPNGAAQKAAGFKLANKYRAFATSFKHMQPFSRSTDGKYPAKTICVLCTSTKPMSVLFPCQHMCVCNNCIVSNDMSPDYSFSLERCVCPVCRTQIRLILPHSGDEEEKYWKWVLATKPQLPPEFTKSFKSAGKKLSEVSFAESRVSTADSLTPQSFTSFSTTKQAGERPYRRSTWTPPIVKRGSAYKLSASTKHESCLIL